MTTINLIGAQSTTQIGVVGPIDRTTFIDEIATLLLNMLPLETIETAVVLVYAYVSEIGWVPSDPAKPLGDGNLSNNFTEAEAAYAIAQSQFNTIYDLNFNVTVTINVQSIAQLIDGLSREDAATQLKSQVSTFIKNKIHNSIIPLEIPSAPEPIDITMNDTAYDLLGGYLGGSTTSEVRVTIADNVINKIRKEIDYKELALQFVYDIYPVDSTWNVESVYTKLNQPIAIIIKKYTDNTYTSLDPDATISYVINVSPDNYQIVAGVIINI